MLKRLPMLTFNAKLHEYCWNGVIKPSVTEILADFIKVKLGNYWYHVNRHTGVAIPSSIMEEAAAIGQDIHKCCQFINQGGLDYGALDPLYIKPSKEYEKWLNLYKPKIIGCEVLVYSEKYGFGGTVDLIAEMMKRLFFIDIKSGMSDSVGPQTKAYERAYCEQHHYTGPTSRGVLWLPKNGGKHKFERLINQQDWNYFLAALTQYNYRRMK